MKRAHIDTLASLVLFGIAAGATGVAVSHVVGSDSGPDRTLTLAIVVAVFAFGGVVFALNETHRAIRRLTQVVRRFADLRQTGEIEEELLSVGGPVTVVDLARAFGRVAKEVRELDGEKDRARAVLESAARLESVGQLAGGVAHGFNNLLTAIVQNREAAETALDGGEIDEVRNLLIDIETEAARGNDLTHQLLAFAQKHPSSPRVLDVNEVARSSVASLSHALPAGLDLVLEADDVPVSTQFDPRQLEQVLSNLVAFCRDSMRGAGSRITVRTRLAELDATLPSEPGLLPGRYVVVEVSDDGPGLAPGSVSRVFEPFGVVQPGPAGQGLGLATVYGLVRQHGGFITVASTRLEGTTFRLYLPWTEAEPAGRKSRLSVEHPAAGHESILVVEDERSVARAIARNLRRLGYDVWEAANGAEALFELGERSSMPDLVLTDVVMPGMGGDELYRQLRERYPGLPVLFMSGYTANALEEDGVLHEGVQLLRKPFTVDQLGRRIRDVLGARSAARGSRELDAPTP